MNLRAAVLVLGTLVCTSTTALADLSLATTKNCMSCHTVQKKVVGPAFKDVALKYVGNKDAEAQLAQKISKGGGGVWGPVPMPANAQVSDADARKLASWILTLK